MTYVLPPDLYKDWKELYFTKELTENIVKQLKEQTVKGTESGKWNEMKQKDKDTIVKVGGYTVIQSAINNHIRIFLDGHCVMHFSCNAKESEEDLKRYVEFYEAIITDKISEDIKKYQKNAR